MQDLPTLPGIRLGQHEATKPFLLHGHSWPLGLVDGLELGGRRADEVVRHGELNLGVVELQWGVQVQSVMGIAWASF